MEMTFGQYIANPMGKSNAILNAVAREAIRKSYIERFHKIMVRERNNINFSLSYDDKHNRYWAHIKVPSEVIKNFYYDVVLEFYATNSVEESGTNLEKYFVRFYSNDPAFVYNYAYVFRRNNLFIKELAPKMSPESLKEKPKEKNSNENVGYVKSLFFAYLIMKERGLFDAVAFKGTAKTFVLNDLLGSIEDADSKISRRKLEQQRLDAQVRKEKKKKAENDKKRVQSAISDNMKIKQTKTVSTATKSVKTTRGIKQTKVIKRK
jgi:hypothetical protein